MKKAFLYDGDEQKKDEFLCSMKKRKKFNFIKNLSILCSVISLRQHKSININSIIHF